MMNLSNEGLILHVGLPKTGTTTIQRALFARHPQLYYLGKIVKNDKKNKDCLDYATYRVLENVLWRLNRPFKAEHAKHLFQDTLRPKIPEGRFLAASWEGLGHRATVKFLEMLRRVKTVFGGCRIIFVLRNPLTQIPSIYIQNLRGHFVQNEYSWLGHKTYVDIETWYRKRDKHISKASPLFNYCSCLRAAIDFLGKENVGIFLFEDLQTDSDSYYRAVCEFMQIDPEVGVSLAEKKHLHGRISQTQVDYLRKVNSSLISRSYVWFLSKDTRRKTFRSKAGGPPAKALLTDDLAREISEATREGHRWLVDNFNLPLEKYDYPL